MGYHFSTQKAAQLYRDNAIHVTTLPKNSSTKLFKPVWRLMDSGDGRKMAEA